MSVAALLANAATIAVLAPCFWLVARAARRPPLTHLLALLLLVKLLTPPIFDLALPVPAAAAVRTQERTPEIVEEVAAAEKAIEGLAPTAMPRLPDSAFELSLADTPVASAAPPASLWRDWPWRATALAVWSLVAVVLAAVAAARLARFAGLLRRFAVPADEREQERARHLGRRLGLRHVPRLDLVATPITPMLWAALGRPRVLVPAGHYAGLPAAERDALVAHELAHYARRDHWVRWLELAAAVAFWWHPVVWLARRALRRAEEECCDARVLEILPGQSRAYAEALLGVIDFVSAEPSLLPVGASGMGEVGSLQRRLTMIMQSRTRSRLSSWGKVGVAALGALVLPLGPGLAQEKSGAEEFEEVQEPVEAKRAARAREEARAREYALEKGASSDRFQYKRQADARAEFDQLTAELRKRFEALMSEGRYGEAKTSVRKLREHLAAMHGEAVEPKQARAAQQDLGRALATKNLYGGDNPLAELLTRRAQAAVEQAAKKLQQTGHADDARNLLGALQGSADAAKLAEAKLRLEQIVSQTPPPPDADKLAAQVARLRDYEKMLQAGVIPAAPSPPADAAHAQIQALEKRVQALSEMIEKLSREMAAQRGERRDDDPVRKDR